MSPVAHHVTKVNQWMPDSLNSKIIVGVTERWRVASIDYHGSYSKTVNRGHPRIGLLLACLDHGCPHFAHFACRPRWLAIILRRVLSATLTSTTAKNGNYLRFLKGAIGAIHDLFPTADTLRWRELLTAPRIASSLSARNWGGGLECGLNMGR